MTGTVFRAQVPRQPELESKRSAGIDAEASSAPDETQIGQIRPTPEHASLGTGRGSLTRRLDKPILN
jgi:hypothetical protein